MSLSTALIKVLAVDYTEFELYDASPEWDQYDSTGLYDEGGSQEPWKSPEVQSGQQHRSWNEKIVNIC